MDDVDKGNYQAELTLQAYIARARRLADSINKPTGFCFNCDDPCPGKVFCSSECRDDFENRAMLEAKLRKQP